MVLLTSKQMIDKLSEYDGIALGAKSRENIIGLSNEFYTYNVLDKVSETLNIKYATRTITHNRTLWLISLNDPNKLLE